MTMRRIAVLSGFLGTGLFLAGCATASIEDAVPAGALSQAPRDDASPAAPAAGTDAPAVAAADDAGRAPTAGTFPDLNVAPTAAAPQISPQDKAADTADLRAKRRQLAGRPPGQATGDGGRLRQLARSHGEAVLKEIEGE